MGLLVGAVGAEGREVGRRATPQKERFTGPGRYFRARIRRSAMGGTGGTGGLQASLWGSASAPSVSPLHSTNQPPVCTSLHPKCSLREQAPYHNPASCFTTVPHMLVPLRRVNSVSAPTSRRSSSMLGGFLAFVCIRKGHLHSCDICTMRDENLCIAHDQQLANISFTQQAHQRL
jgi:hypothetical protein